MFSYSSDLTKNGSFRSGTNYAYVADANPGLQVIDVSNPASPSLVGSCDTPDMAVGVYVSGHYAYVAAWSEGLQVIDVSNPASPNLVGSCDTPGSAYEVYVSGDNAYVADGSSGLQVINVNNPSSPNLVGSCDTPDFALGVYVSVDNAYVADAGSGLQIIDVSNPESPSLIGSCYTPGNAFDVYVSGSHAYVANESSRLQVIDVSNPASPSLIGSCYTPDFAEGVHISGGHAYVAAAESGLQVISVSVPFTGVTFVSETQITATVPAGLAPGTYDLHVTNPDGGSAILQNAFTVTDTPPAPVAEFTADQTTGDKPLTVQFTDESTGIITSWSWAFGDGGTSSQQSPLYTYPDAGDYTVSLTVTGPGGDDTKTKPGHIHVDPGTQALVIDNIKGVKEPGKVIRIIGSGFGATQGDSEVHIGPKVYGPGNTKIKLWTDTMIKVRLKEYSCAWFEGNDFRRRKAWVTVGGVDSNKKRFKVFKPDTCP